MDSILLDEVQGLVRAGRKREAQLIYGVAKGTATPLASLAEQWLSEGGRSGPFKDRTKADHRRAVKQLEDWLRTEGVPETLQAVDRTTVGKFVSKALHGSGKAPKTVAKTISSLSSYWDWLRRRGHIPDDTRSPWADQAPPKTASQGREKERAFTREEVSQLIANAPGGTLRDFMTVAALSGMRREEIGKLTVADCANDLFIVQSGKTQAARRRVPIHPALEDLVRKRCVSKGPEAYLFNELKAEGKIATARQERTDAIGKRFGRYRDDLGLTDRTTGTRRSLVNFHSFRRFFVTEAINAGSPPHLVSLVVGHEEGRHGMTLGRYWSGADDGALRAVVECVKI